MSPATLCRGISLPQWLYHQTQGNGTEQQPAHTQRRPSTRHQWHPLTALEPHVRHNGVPPSSGQSSILTKTHPDRALGSSPLKPHAVTVFQQLRQPGGHSESFLCTCPLHKPRCHGAGTVLRPPPCRACEMTVPRAASSRAQGPPRTRTSEGAAKAETQRLIFRSNSNIVRF